MAVALPPVTTRKRLYDLLPPDVQRAYPVNSLMRGYRAVVEQEVPDGMPEGLQQAIGRRLTRVLPQATQAAALRRRLARPVAESPAGAAEEVAAENVRAGYERAGVPGKALMRFYEGVRHSLPSLSREPLEPTVPPATREWEKLTEGAGGIGGFTAVAAPVTAATAGLGAPALLAGAAGAGVSAAAAAGTPKERLVRGVVTAAVAPAAEVAGGAVGGIIGKRAGGAVAKAANRYVAQPAVSGVAFGSVQPVVENQVRKHFGMESHPFTMRDVVEGGFRMAALSALTHGAQDLTAASAARARRGMAEQPEGRAGGRGASPAPAEAPESAATAGGSPARPNAAREAVDAFLAPPPRLTPEQVAGAARRSQAISDRLAGREFLMVPDGALEPVRVRIVRVNEYPGRVAVLAEDAASGRVVPMVYRDLAEMTAAVKPAGSAGAPPMPEVRTQQTPPQVERRQVTATYNAERVAAARKTIADLEQRIAQDPGNAKRRQWENKLGRAREELARRGGNEVAAGSSPEKPTEVLAAPGPKTEKAATALARGKGEESPSTPPPIKPVEPTPPVTAPAEARTPPQETAGSTNFVTRGNGERVAVEGMHYKHLFGALIQRLRSPQEGRGPEHAQEVARLHAEVKRRGLEGALAKEVERRAAAEAKKAEKARAAAAPEAPPAAPESKPAVEGAPGSGVPAASPAPEVVRPPAPPVEEPVRKFKPGDRVKVPYTGRGWKKIKYGYRDSAVVKGYDAEGLVLVEVRRGKRVLLEAHEERLVGRRRDMSKVPEARVKKGAEVGAVAVAVGSDLRRAELVVEAARERFRAAKAAEDAIGAEADAAKPGSEEFKAIERRRYDAYARRAQAEAVLRAAEQKRAELVEGEAGSWFGAQEDAPSPVEAGPSKVLAERAAADPKHFDAERVKAIEDAREVGALPQSETALGRLLDYDQRIGGEAAPEHVYEAVGRVVNEHAAVTDAVSALRAVVEKAVADGDKPRAAGARKVIAMLKESGKRIDDLNAMFGPKQVAERIAFAKSMGKSVADELYSIRKDIEREFPSTPADDLPPDLNAAPWDRGERGFVTIDMLHRVMGVTLFRDMLRGIPKALERIRRAAGKDADTRIVDNRNGVVLKRITETYERDPFEADAFTRFMAALRAAGGDAVLPKELLAKFQLAESGEALGFSRDKQDLLDALGDEGWKSVLQWSTGGREAFDFIDSGGKAGRANPAIVKAVTGLFDTLIERENVVRERLGLPPVKPRDNYIAHLTQGDYALGLQPDFLTTLFGRPVGEAEARDMSLRFHQHREDYDFHQRDLMTALIARLAAHHRFMQYAPVVHEVNEWLRTEGAKTKNLKQAKMVRAWVQGTYFRRSERGMGWWNDQARKLLIASHFDAPREVEAKDAAAMVGRPLKELEAESAALIVGEMGKGGPDRDIRPRYFVAHENVKVSDNANPIGKTTDGDVVYRTLNGVAHGQNELAVRGWAAKLGTWNEYRRLSVRLAAAGVKVEKAERLRIAHARMMDQVRNYDRRPAESLLQFLAGRQRRALLGLNTRAVFQNLGNTLLTTLPEMWRHYGYVGGSRAFAEAHAIQLGLSGRSAVRGITVPFVDMLARKGYLSAERAQQYRDAIPTLTAEVLAEGVGSLQGEARRAQEDMRHVMDAPRTPLGDLLGMADLLKPYQFVEDMTRGADALAWVIAGQRAGMKGIDIWKSWGSNERSKLDAWQYILEQAGEKGTSTRHAMDMSIRTMFNYGPLGRAMFASNPIARSMLTLTTFPLNFLRKYDAPGAVAAVGATAKSALRGRAPDAYTQSRLRLLLAQTVAAGLLLKVGDATGINTAIFGIPGYLTTVLGWLKELMPNKDFKRWYQAARRGSVVSIERGPAGLMGPSLGAAVEAMKQSDYVSGEEAFQKRHAGDDIVAKSLARATEQMWPAMRGLVLQYTVPALIQLKRTAQITKTLEPLRKPLGVRSYLDPEEATLWDRLRYQTGTLPPERQAELQRRTFQKPKGQKFRFKPAKGRRQALGAL